MQRLGVGSELPGLLREMGADPATLFAEIGVGLGDVTPDLRLDVSRLLHLLDRAVRVTACAHLGLLCGLRFELRHHGILGELMRTAPTLRVALEEFAAWQPGYSSGAIVYLHRSGPDDALGYALYTPTSPGAAVLYDAIVAVAVRMLEHLTGLPVAPVEVQLSRAAPASPGIYDRLLRAPVRFDQDRSCVVLDQRSMRLRLPGADAVRHREAQDLLAAAGRWPDRALSDRVRREIRRALLQGPARMPSVAERLALDDRTLRRKLKAEGTTFRDLNDEVRLTLARELLDLTSLPIGDIASATGFASASVFAESYRRWTGTTATDRRLAGARYRDARA